MTFVTVNMEENLDKHHCHILYVFYGTFRQVSEGVVLQIEYQGFLTVPAWVLRIDHITHEFET